MSNASTIRRINRSAILDLIREQSPISPTEISRRLKISLPTVTRIVADLEAEKLVREEGKAESSGGRPRSLLAFNGSAHSVIVIDAGMPRMYGAVADLAGTIHYEDYLAHLEPEHDPLNDLYTLIERLLDQTEQPVRGIGIGVPGITQVPEGRVVWAPSLQWSDLPLQKMLVDRFDLPVFVENDQNLAALAEWGFGAAHGARTLVCIVLRIGIGSGIIIDGTLFRGHEQAAGEIGYFVPDTKMLGKNYARFGPLEVVLFDMDEEGERLSLERTIESTLLASQNGEAWAIEQINDVIEYLALAVANVAAMLNPEVIVLNAGAVETSRTLIDSIRQRIQGMLPYVPRLVESDLGHRALALGAIVHVLNGTTNQIVVSRRI
jgi:predicted NBD/HSP70 family sugar kinase